MVIVAVWVCVGVGVGDEVIVIVINRIPLLAADVATIGSMLLPYGTINAVFVAVIADDVCVADAVVVGVFV
jgi:hypothetical protein